MALFRYKFEEQHTVYSTNLEQGNFLQWLNDMVKIQYSGVS